MNRDDGFERVLGEWLVASAPTAAPAALHGDAIERVRRTPQRRGMAAALGRTVAQPASRGRVLRLSVIGAALVALSVIGVLLTAGTRGGPEPTPVPATAAPATAAPATAVASASPTQSPDPTPSSRSTTVDSFAKPFRYTLPVGTALIGMESPESTGYYTLGQGVVPSTPDVASGAQGEFMHGLILASVEDAWVHGCGSVSGRVPVRAPAAEFLEDMRAIGGFVLDDIGATTIDGLPAQIFSLNLAQSRCPYDVHVGGRITGLTGDFVRLSMPSRLFVVEVDDTTIVVDIWSRTPDDFASWLPAALEVVRSIDFLAT